MKLVDPTVRPAAAARKAAPRLATLDGARIALLNNGKVNSDVLLRETAQLFAREHGAQVVAFELKGHASKPAAPDLLVELHSAADFLMTAAGD